MSIAIPEEPQETKLVKRIRANITKGMADKYSVEGTVEISGDLADFSVDEVVKELSDLFKKLIKEIK
jgi:hypothetical protein|tara:strand:- start:2108 stop:2308 length:201 start_codon:yes stop_codon:yes gene_type:complete